MMGMPYYTLDRMWVAEGWEAVSGSDYKVTRFLDAMKSFREDSWQMSSAVELTVAARSSTS